MSPFAWQVWRLAWALNDDDRIDGYKRIVALLWWKVVS